MRKLSILLFVVVLLSISSATALGQVGEVFFVRIGHFSADAGAVDIYIDSELAIQNLSFPNATGWIELPVGTRHGLVITPAGQTMDEGILSGTTIDMFAGDWITVALIGNVEHGTFGTYVLFEDFSEIGVGETRLSVFNAISGGLPVNVLGNDIELVHMLGYPGYVSPESDGFTSTDIIAQPYHVKLTLDDGTTFIDVGQLVLGEGRNYFLGVVGLYSNPEFVFITTNPDDLLVSDVVVGNVDLGDGMMYARIAHLAPGTGDVDVYLDGRLGKEGLSFPGIAEWSDMPAGVYNIAVVPTGMPLGEAIFEGDVSLGTDTRVTIAVIGSLETGTLAVQPLVEDFSEIGAGETRLGVFNAVSGGLPLNVSVNGNVLINALSYPTSSNLDNDGFSSNDIIAQSYRIEVNYMDGTSFIDLGELLLGDGRSYFIALTGLANSPVYVIERADP